MEDRVTCKVAIIHWRGSHLQYGAVARAGEVDAPVGQQQRSAKALRRGDGPNRCRPLLPSGTASREERGRGGGGLWRDERGGQNGEGYMGRVTWGGLHGGGNMGRITWGG